MAEDAATRPWYIYGLYDPREPEVIRYVGWTIRANPQQRLTHHVGEARAGRVQTFKARWIRKLLSEGVKPLMQVIETGVGAGWDAAEIRWIAQHRAIVGDRLTNGTLGGEGCPGRVVTEEQRLKLRAHRHTAETCARIGAAHRGKTNSTETRAKISEARSRQVLSPDHGAKIGAALRGRKKTPAHIAKSAAARRGQKRSPAQCARISAGQRARGRKEDPAATEKRIAPLRGVPRTEEVKAKIRATKARKRAERLAQGDTIEAFVVATGISFDTDDRPMKVRLR